MEINDNVEHMKNINDAFKKLLYVHFRSNGEKLSADKKYLLIAKEGVQVYRQGCLILRAPKEE